MNSRQIVASLNKIANELDNNGMYQEANNLTKIMKKLAFDTNMNFLESKDDFGDQFINIVRNVREAVQEFVSYLYQKIDNQEELQNLKERPIPAYIMINEGNWRDHSDLSKTTYTLVGLNDGAEWGDSTGVKNGLGREFVLHRDPMKEKIRGLFLHNILKLNDSDNSDDYCEFALAFSKYFDTVEIGVGNLGKELQDKLAKVLRLFKGLAYRCSTEKKS